MKRTMWSRRLACVFLAVGTVAGVALAAGTQGSQSDPLVTLSYLNEVAVPEIMRQVDSKLDQRLAALGGQQGGGSATFVTVDVGAGQAVALSAGAQFLVRSNSLFSTDALVDVTSGAIWNGGNLPMNHLFLSPGEGLRVTASSAGTLMIQGGYTLN